MVYLDKEKMKKIVLFGFPMWVACGIQTFLVALEENGKSVSMAKSLGEVWGWNEVGSESLWLEASWWRYEQ